MKELKNKIADAQKGMFPFVIYRKPNSNSIIGVFQKNEKANYTDDLSENGFVFAPFDDNETSFIIPYLNADIHTFVQTINPEFNHKKKNVQTNINKEDHVKLVKDGIDFIRDSDVDKVVLSRKEEVNFENFDLIETFQKLCNFYPNAFVYLWSHSETGIWMGASPERLLTVKNNKFKVMALASTQEFKGVVDVQWGEKEIKEHQYVVDYIADKIEDFGISISETYTVKAGNLLHLRADIRGGISNENISLEPLIRVLHPTPAVCGLPKEKAKSFILQNENYNREFYTGFLGELYDQEADLFVNLRCMKIDLENKTASIYVGGGITKDSVPEKEWLETVVKSNVMKKVLN